MPGQARRGSQIVTGKSESRGPLCGKLYIAFNLVNVIILSLYKTSWCTTSCLKFLRGRTKVNKNVLAKFKARIPFGIPSHSGCQRLQLESYPVTICMNYTRKNAQVVTTCYQAVTRFIRTACSQSLTSLHKLLSTCNKLDDDYRLATSLFQQVDIVWT